MVKPFFACGVHLLPMDLTQKISDYEVLCKVVTTLNNVITNINEIEGQVNINTGDIKALQELTNYLKGELEKIANGEYMDVYIDALAKWIDKNLQEIVARIVKQVFFGLGTPNTPSEGHFVAYIPESWSDIQFDTIMSCGDNNYGRLVLKY